MSASYGEKVLALRRDRKLFSALLELTYRCNLDCFFCYNDVALKGKPLTLADYKRLLDDLATLGVLYLDLSGGEPLANPDFFAIGADARAKGFVVRVKSNGHALRGALARRLRDEVDPYVVEVSLHGATAATHDRQTRVPGSFERLVANLGELVGLGFRVKINSTLTAYNESEIEGMFALADGLGLQLQFDPDVTPRDDGDREPLGIGASRAGVKRLYLLERERAEAMAAKFGFDPDAESEIGRQTDAGAPSAGPDGHCGAGTNHLAIDPYGNVYPCVQWRRASGNLHERSLLEIWASSRGLGEVRDLQGEIRRRLEETGPDHGLLNFCPGAAETHTGDSTAIYGAAASRRELQHELAAERPAAARSSKLRVLG